MIGQRFLKCLAPVSLQAFAKGSVLCVRTNLKSGPLQLRLSLHLLLKQSLSANQIRAFSWACGLACTSNGLQLPRNVLALFKAFYGHLIPQTSFSVFGQSLLCSTTVTLFHVPTVLNSHYWFSFFKQMFQEKDFTVSNLWMRSNKDKLCLWVGISRIL